MCVQKLDNFIHSGTSVPAVPPPSFTEHLLKSKEHGDIHVPAGSRPLSVEWISEELLLETRKLWSKAYGRVISIDEAIEILMNVKRLAEVLARI